jgi:tetratricopeptide (TPR) repeat protein
VLWLIAGLYLSGFAGADTSPVTLDKLVQAKRALGEDPRLALAADVAIAAWMRWNKPKEGVALFEALHRSRPYDRHLWRDYITALERADQDELAFTEMEKWISSNPDRDGAHLFYMDGAKGRWPAMRERALQRLQQGKTNASELNAIAWRALFEPAVDIAQAVSLAEEAVRMSNRKDFATMHTLATLYAEQGRHDAALKTIAEAAGLTREYPVPSSIWYVHGRSAEALGFVQEARTYYERCLQVERANDDPIMGTGPTPGSTEQLATLRLKALDAAKRK